MNSSIRLFLLPVLALSAPVRADDPVPALRGLERLRERFGPESVALISEMTGVNGDPQPSAWRVTAHDAARSGVLHEFWIGERRVTDEGLNDDFYPDRLPKAFFRLKRVKLDSTQAFAIAEQVARDAGSGFDSVNYKLHGREYTNEPVWTLTLLDSEEEIVGSIHLSADTGNVLRTVWMHRTRSGRLVVEDSALAAGSRELAGPDAAEKDPETDPPAAAEPTPPTPTDPEAAPPATKDEPVPDTKDDDAEIPEIKRLKEAQEKAGETPPKKP